MIDGGEKDAEKVVEAIKAEISKEALARIDYVEMVDLNSLEAIKEVKAPLLTAMAVYIGKTRLIDNFIIE